METAVNAPVLVAPVPSGVDTMHFLGMVFIALTDAHKSRSRKGIHVSRSFYGEFKWSGWRDSNPRPLQPHCSRLYGEFARSERGRGAELVPEPPQLQQFLGRT